MVNKFWALIWFCCLGITFSALAGGEDPTKANTLYNQAWQKIEAKQYNAASLLLKKVVEFAPKNAEAWRDLGACYAKLNKHPEAIKALETAQKFNPTDDYTKHLGAISHEALGNYKKAARLLESISQTTYTDTVLVNLGNLYDRLEKPEHALNAYGRARAINPKNELAEFGEANALCKLKKYEEALPLYNHLIEHASPRPEFFFNRAMSLFRMRKLQEAIFDFGKALSISPRYANAIYMRGLCFFEANDDKTACSEWQKAAAWGDKDAITMIKRHCK